MVMTKGDHLDQFLTLTLMLTDTDRNHRSHILSPYL
jgi:hypothetical protein